MNGNAYEDIMALRGYEEFKALAQRLNQLAESRKSLSGTRIPVPNFLFVEAPGAGVTTQLRLLTRLLMERRLMRFMGEKRFFACCRESERASRMRGARNWHATSLCA